MLSGYGANIETRGKVETRGTTGSETSLLIPATANRNEEGALLLLARGADPSDLDEKWYLAHHLSGGEIPQMPDYLKTWQMAIVGELTEEHV
jgi:hypothetical protein